MQKSSSNRTKTKGRVENNFARRGFSAIRHLLADPRHTRNVHTTAAIREDYYFESVPKLHSVAIPLGLADHRRRLLLYNTEGRSPRPGYGLRSARWNSAAGLSSVRCPDHSPLQNSVG